MSSKSRRFWFISCSIAGHLALGIGVFVSGVWRIERLDADRRSLSTLAVLAQAASSGGSVSLPTPKLQPKPLRIVHEVIQPPKVKPASDLPPVTTVPTSGSGSGSGSDEGSGSGSGSASIGQCLTPPCGEDPVTTPPAPRREPAVDTDTLVPPNVLTMMRTSGTTQVHPPDVVKTQMLRDGKDRSVGVLKVCVSETGVVSSVNVMSSTRYAAFDDRLVDAVRGWTYRPYAAKGRNVRVCGTVTFVYAIR
ncbi:MAG: putative TonB protein [Deltaproteobacteria bacterium]|nr:putative TonB protein [Deltaproteobacteria bacterium]